MMMPRSYRSNKFRSRARRGRRCQRLLDRRASSCACLTADDRHDPPGDRPTHPYTLSLSLAASQPHRMQRKASPPRPTLLVGDLAACHRTYDDLNARVQAALSGSASSSKAVWQDMIPRFRALRESIIHLDERSIFSLQAYELAAGACWRADDWGEFLKCAQQLVFSIYPRFHPQAYAADQAANSLQEAAPTNPRAAEGEAEKPCKWTYRDPKGKEQGPFLGSRLLKWENSGFFTGSLLLRRTDQSEWTTLEEARPQMLLQGIAPAHATRRETAPAVPYRRRALDEDSLGRLPEFAAANILYFSCVVQNPEPFEVSVVLRQLPRALVSVAMVRFAITAASCLFSKDFSSFLRLRDEAPTPMLGRLMDARAEVARHMVLDSLSSAFRQLPAQTAASMLGLLDKRKSHVDMERLLALLKTAAERGNHGAQNALQAVQAGVFEDDSNVVPTLVFKS